MIPFGTDALSVILRELRFSGVLCCHGIFASPWGVKGPDAHMPLFHFVYEGRAVLSIEGVTHELEVGDLALLPRGTSHVIHDGSGERCVSIHELLPERTKPGVHRITMGEGEPTSRSICGIFFIDEKMMLPFWSSLPSILHIRRAELAERGWLPGMLEGLTVELEAASPGAIVLATKMSEIVFLLALRCFMERTYARDSGWLYALQEPRLGRAIQAIHEEYGRSWSLTGLAELAGMSRSAFAAAFKRHTGESPMSYLTLTRMRQSLCLLESGLWELKAIAAKVGFRSYVGFHNAFKRTYQCTPGEYREQFQ